MTGTMHYQVAWSVIRAVGIASLLVVLIAASPARAASGFQDPLDFPAQMRSSVATRPLLAIARAGDQLVAVGSRGLIVRSEDQGKSWTQSVVPVQSDLLAVHFPNPRDGWAVGHDGVILSSHDGGKSWTKQFDGRLAAEAFKKFYAADGADPAMRTAAAQVEQNFKAGPALPYLDVWFEDADKGFVVGSFGMIAATSDGGKTWEPWLHRMENDQSLNLNGIRGIEGDIYIVGERGIVLKLDRANRRFKTVDTGYAGSFFGIAGNAEVLLAFGLRGVAYRSGDAGRSWEALKMPAETTINGATVRRDPAGFILINNAGQILTGDVTARSFQLGRAENPMRYTGVVLGNNDSVIVTGMGGVRTERLGNSPK